VSLRRFAAAPDRGGLGGGELLADSDAVSGVDGGSAGGWLAASGLREAHPDTTVRTDTTKTAKSADLKEPISRVDCAAESNRELYCWANCWRGFATFTGGP
jgi:hypothetical protein